MCCGEPQHYSSRRELILAEMGPWKSRARRIAGIWISERVARLVSIHHSRRPFLQQTHQRVLWTRWSEPKMANMLWFWSHSNFASSDIARYHPSRLGTPTFPGRAPNTAEVARNRSFSSCHPRHLISQRVLNMTANLAIENFKVSAVQATPIVKSNGNARSSTGST